MTFLPAQRCAALSFARALLLAGVGVAFAISPGAAQPRASDSPAFAVPVVVTNFELYWAPLKPKPAPRAAAKTEPEKPKVPLVYSEDDEPLQQARRMTDDFAMTLVRELEKKGFSASRVSGKNPPNGALVRGVFTEPDALNRIRRAVLGATTPSGKFLLYVGIFNLERQEQPLYQLATGQIPSAGYGPIITLNNYVPLAKYELDKNPSEEEVQKICTQIAASLVSLLESNPHAFAH